jgi:4-amino-4-deoxy-L-arabinose transferase-like glycosyltransferase
MIPPRSAPSGRLWALVVILALAPVWVIGILDRGLWTPDEPREADIAWRMSQQSDRTLPELAGTPFLEKPPLSYWMSAGALNAFGESAGAARAPNILYAAVTALAIGALAFAMQGSVTGALVAALVAGTAITAFRVAIWLAPDACLLAGCAISLLGAYQGYTAPPGRRKLLGYALLHTGAAVGFMAKSAPGWLVPALALATIIVWERRWSELRRWELYAGFVLQALIIGPWIFAVTRTAHGTDALLALFWYNIVGRFTQVAAPAALDYTGGHRNSPGKYLLELPIYLLPWTLLAAAALRRAWDRVRAPGAEGTSWRFAVAATLPFLVLLSIAATARDIYIAPVLLGFSVLVALWAGEARRETTGLDETAIRWTRGLVGLIACIFAAVLCILAGAGAGIVSGVAALCVIAVSFTSLRFAAQSQRTGDLGRSFAWTYVAYAAALCLTALAAFPVVDRWQNLPALAARIHVDSQHDALALLNPDETTIAMLDRGLRTRFTILITDSDTTPEQVVSTWFNTQGGRARVLVLMPGHAPGELTRLLDRVHQMRDPDDGIAGTLAAEGAVSVLRRYELPQGRRYALLGPPPRQPAVTVQSAADHSGT